ncbi:MAG: DUF1559 domain-containing protein [Planctomycetaceae bacterium]|nr:DUF1559 domain-containing protein [Planctomycetaceae bacterium]
MGRLSMQKHHKHYAFTLVELLVVIAIIGILIALLLPAVQAAREAARRSQCTNNLKQIALATHNYHDTHKVFPPAAVWLANYGTDSANFRDGGYGATWATMLLPFMEQSALHDQYDFSLPSDHDVNEPVVSTNIAGLRCPSDDELTPTSNSGDTNPNNRYAKGNYAARAGGLYSNENGAPNGWENAQWKGPFTYRPVRSTKMADIRDGTSNTVFFSEILGQPSGGDCRGAWGRVACNTFSPHTRSTADEWILGPNANTKASTNLYDAPPYCGSSSVHPECTDDASDGSGGTGARSRHPGGVNCALGDGSVRFVSETIDRLIWRAALTIQAGDNSTGI